MFRCYTQIVFFCQRPAWHRDSVTHSTLSVGVTLTLCFLSVSALHRDRCYPGHFVFRCYTQVVFFCQCPRGIVTVLPMPLCLSVLHSHCVFLSVSALHRDSVTQGTLSFSVTLTLCFLSVSALHRDSVTQDFLSFGVTLNFFFSASAWHRDSVTQDTLSFGVTLNFFFSASAWHRDRCYPGHFVFSVLHSNCVFWSVSAWHRGSVTQGTLSVGFTLTLFFFYIRVAL